MSAPAQPRVLVHRRVDALLVGWLAVIVWIAGFLGARFGVGPGVGVTLVIFWVGAVLTAAHFALSYHLAYRGGAPALRKRPVVLAVAPIVLMLLLAVTVGAALVGGHAWTTRLVSALITSVYLMTIWHYVKQVYGVGRVGAGFAGVRLSETEGRVLRYGLYPLWFVGAARVLVSNAYDLGGYRYGYDLLPVETFRILQWCVAAAAVPIAVVFVRVARRQHAMPPGVMLAPYVAAFLWLGLPTSPALTTLYLAAFHALQYLAVGHRAEVALVADEPGRHGAAWWLNIFAGAACGGLLLSRWLPDQLDARFGLHDQLIFGAAVFVFLNLHHYLIDASIWRSKGELIKAMGRRPGTATVSPTPPVPAPVKV